MLGIVILNYNSYEDAIKCVESILKTTSIDFKIYLVDNKSQDNSLKYFTEKYSKESKVIIISAENNGGYSAGNNLGVSQALKDGVKRILISNSDIIFKKNSIDEMYKFSNSNPNAAVISPKIVNLDGSILEDFYTFRTFLDFFSFRLLPKRWVKYIRQKRANITFDSKKNLWFSGMKSGSCFMIKTDILEKFGLFDDRVFLYYEELILAKKLMESSIRSVYLNKVEVVHTHRYSTENHISPIGVISLCQSRLYYLRNYMDINILQWSIIFILQLIRYSLKSLRKKNFRYNFKTFINKSIETLT